MPSSVQMVASEYKEEEIVEALSQFLPSSTPSKRYCVDVGARCCSNDNNGSVSHWLLEESSYRLYPNEQQHWSGILIQPDSNHYKELRQLHDPMGNRCLQITPSAQEGLNERSLVWILRQFSSQLPMDFDFLCLSEGARWSNYWVLRDFLECQTYKPRLICAPFDMSLPNDVAYVPPRGDRYGVPSILGLVQMALEFNYQLVMTTSKCAFFVPTKLFQEHLKATIKRPPSTRSASPQKQESQQRLQESRDQLGSSDRKALQSPREEIIDTEAYITAGRQWLAERRQHLERDEKKTKKAKQSFKKQVTSAWQQRKATIIDSIQRQTAKRRHPNPGKSRFKAPVRDAADPPESPSKKATEKSNIFSHLERKVADEKRVPPPKRINRFLRPDPPEENHRVIETLTKNKNNNEGDSKVAAAQRPIKERHIAAGEEGKQDPADIVDSTLGFRNEGYEWSKERTKSHAESLAKSSQYFSDSIDRYKKELSASDHTNDNAENDRRLPKVDTRASVDFEEEEIVFYDEARDPAPLQHDSGRVIDMNAHFSEYEGRDEELMERA
ncbi:MAG: hypothetical protein SGILL_006036, partial [Bacillariaceae sp.]